MTKQEIIENVNTLMAAKAGIKASEIKPEDFYDNLCANSIECIEVLMNIESVFGINIPSVEMFHVTTMQQVYDLVEQIYNEK